MRSQFVSETIDGGIKVSLVINDGEAVEDVVEVLCLEGCECKFEYNKLHIAPTNDYAHFVIMNLHGDPALLPSFYFNQEEMLDVKADAYEAVDGVFIDTRPSRQEDDLSNIEILGDQDEDGNNDISAVKGKQKEDEEGDEEDREEETESVKQDGMLFDGRTEDEFVNFAEAQKKEVPFYDDLEDLLEEPITFEIYDETTFAAVYIGDEASEPVVRYYTNKIIDEVGFDQKDDDGKIVDFLDNKKYEAVYYIPLGYLAIDNIASEILRSRQVEGLPVTYKEPVLILPVKGGTKEKKDFNTLLLNEKKDDGSYYTNIFEKAEIEKYIRDNGKDPRIGFSLAINQVHFIPVRPLRDVGTLLSKKYDTTPGITVEKITENHKEASVLTQLVLDGNFAENLREKIAWLINFMGDKQDLVNKDYKMLEETLMVIYDDLNHLEFDLINDPFNSNLANLIYHLIRNSKTIFTIPHLKLLNAHALEYGRAKDVLPKGSDIKESFRKYSDVLFCFCNIYALICSIREKGEQLNKFNNRFNFDHKEVEFEITRIKISTILFERYPKVMAEKILYDDKKRAFVTNLKSALELINKPIATSATRLSFLKNKCIFDIDISSISNHLVSLADNLLLSLNDLLQADWEATVEDMVNYGNIEFTNEHTNRVDQLFGELKHDSGYIHAISIAMKENGYNSHLHPQVIALLLSSYRVFLNTYNDVIADGIRDNLDKICKVLDFLYQGCRLLNSELNMTAEAFVQQDPSLLSARDRLIKNLFDLCKPSDVIVKKAGEIPDKACKITLISITMDVVKCYLLEDKGIYYTPDRAMPESDLGVIRAFRLLRVLEFNTYSEKFKQLVLYALLTNSNSTNLKERLSQAFTSVDPNYSQTLYETLKAHYGVNEVLQPLLNEVIRIVEPQRFKFASSVSIDPNNFPPAGFEDIINNKKDEILEKSKHINTSFIPNISFRFNNDRFDDDGSLESSGGKSFFSFRK